jgi:TIR domain-containing protein
MPDVFISYSKKHRPLTERVAALLDGEESVGPDGKSKRIRVSWDQSLTSGDVFHREITDQIDKAGAVVVIWTEGAVASDWVYAEAQRGAAQKSLCRYATRRLPTTGSRFRSASSISTMPIMMTRSLQA